MSEANLKIVDMQALSQGDRNHVSEVLKEALEADFDEVIIFGFKNGEHKVHLRRSKIVSTQASIGALEYAKLWLYEHDS